MRLTWKIVAVFTLFLFLGLVAVACGPQASPAEKAPAPRRLKILQWSHFVPAYDKWFDAWAEEWGKKNNVTVTIDHLPHLEVPARLAIEVAAQKGHDIWQSTIAPGAHYYAAHIVDVSDVMEGLGKKSGDTIPYGKEIAFVEGKWRAIPSYYISMPMLVRKDLHDRHVEGAIPDTWEQLAESAAKVKKASGAYFGTGFGHHADANITTYSLLFSFGASVQGPDSRTVTINSPQTIAALKFMRGLFDEGMDPAILAWTSDADNNKFLAAGGYAIHNAISAYRTIEKSNPPLAEKIVVGSPLAGPAGRHVVGIPLVYGIWKFSPNVELAKAFLRDWAIAQDDSIKASEGYNHSVWKKWSENMPVLRDEPKMRALLKYGDFIRSMGYPGQQWAGIEEVWATFVIPDMFMKVLRAKPGEVDKVIEEAILAAEKDVKRIFAKYP